MTRTVAAAAVAFCLSTTTLYAQSLMPQITEVTVKTAPANVHKFPTVASTVIGKAPIGTVIEVKRNLGSWVEVAWPGGENGVGFLHVYSVTITRRQAQASHYAVAPSSSAATTQATQDQLAWLIKEILAAAPGASNPGVSNPGVSPRPSQVILPSHVIGVGARSGRMSSFVSDLGAADLGASARAWVNGRLGVQFEVSRSRIASLDGRGHATSLHVAPSVLYSLPNGITNSFWLRPYVGAGSSFYRATLNSGTSSPDPLPVNKGMAFRAFGGVEATFAGAPQFALSVDAGHSWRQTSVAGSTPDRIGLSLSGHWYVK
jgi:hypothetical protein